MYGQQLRKLRKEHNLTQVKLAQLLNTTQSTIGKLEREELEPNINMLIKISKIFNTSTDYILGLKDEYGFDLNSDDTYSFEYSHGKTKLIHYEQKKPTNK